MEGWEDEWKVRVMEIWAIEPGEIETGAMEIEAREKFRRKTEGQTKGQKLEIQRKLN
jgi:hypothetical protein